MTNANNFDDLSDIKWDGSRALKGSNSAFGTCNGYFLKILTKKPEIHDLLIRNEIEFTPKFINYRLVNYEEFKNFTKKNDIDLKIEKHKGAHLYTFEKINFKEIPVLIKNEGITKDLIKNLLYSITCVFSKLYEHGYTYHDACWKNIIWNTDKNEPFIIDIDSALYYDRVYDKRSFAQQTFHQVYLSIERKNEQKFNNLQFFDVCIITNLFFSFMLGYYFDDAKKFLNEDGSANALARTLIENESLSDQNSEIAVALNDALSNSALKKVSDNAMTCLYNCIKYENVYPINNLIELVDDIPRQSVICPKCRHANNADEIYCQRCEYQISGMRTCPNPNCKRDIPTKSLYCRECGHYL